MATATGAHVEIERGDTGPRIVRVFSSEIAALRSAVKNSDMGGDVVFLHYGETLDEAIIRENLAKRDQLDIPTPRAPRVRKPKPAAAEEEFPGVIAE